MARFVALPFLVTLIGFNSFANTIASESQLVWTETSAGVRCAEFQLVKTQYGDDRWEVKYLFAGFRSLPRCVSKFGALEYFSSRGYDGTLRCGVYTPLAAGLVDVDGRFVARRAFIQYSKDLSKCDPNRRIEFTRSERD